MHLLSLNQQDVLQRNVRPPRRIEYVRLTLWGPVGYLSHGAGEQLVTTTLFTPSGYDLPEISGD